VHAQPVRENAYLEDFYTDIKKHSFAMQVYLLNKRFLQQQQIIWQNKGGVQDRTIYEDSVFAKMLCDSGLMERRDYETYRELFNNMSNFMRKPNMIIYLDRIRARARGCETGISLEYLRNLHAAYESFIADIARVIPVLRVDYHRFRDEDEMAERIAREYARIANIRDIRFDDADATVGAAVAGAAAAAAAAPAPAAGDGLAKGATAPTGSPGVPAASVISPARSAAGDVDGAASGVTSVPPSPVATRLDLDALAPV
jgi:deoxyadenosine kinase